MSNEIKDILQASEKQFEEYSKLVELAMFVAEIKTQSESQRTINYPLGIVLDQRSVNALVG